MKVLFGITPIKEIARVEMHNCAEEVKMLIHTWHTCASEGLSKILSILLRLL